MTFRTTLNVSAVIIAALVGALTILVGNWIFGEIDPDDIAVAVGFVAGELTCLWTAFSRRERAVR